MDSLELHAPLPTGILYSDSEFMDLTGFLILAPPVCENFGNSRAEFDECISAECISDHLHWRAVPVGGGVHWPIGRLASIARGVPRGARVDSRVGEGTVTAGAARTQHSAALTQHTILVSRASVKDGRSGRA